MPAIVLLSTGFLFRMRRHLSVALRTTGGCQRARGINYGLQAENYGAPELEDPRYHLSCRLVNQDLIPIQQSDDRIGVALNEFNEIGVHGDLLVI
jgi:hypothetical protein